MIKFNLLNSIIGGQYRLIVMPEIPHYKRIAPILDKRPDNLRILLRISKPYPASQIQSGSHMKREQTSMRCWTVPRRNIRR